MTICKEGRRHADRVRMTRSGHSHMHHHYTHCRDKDGGMTCGCSARSHRRWHAARREAAGSLPPLPASTPCCEKKFFQSKGFGFIVVDYGSWFIVLWLIMLYIRVYWI